MNEQEMIVKEFAAKHPEIRMEIIEEMMKRIKIINKEGQERMIYYLSPWLEGIQLLELPDLHVKQLIYNLIMITYHHSSSPSTSNSLSTIWYSIASSASNVSIVVKLLLQIIIERVCFSPFYSLSSTFLSLPSVQYIFSLSSFLFLPDHYSTSTTLTSRFLFPLYPPSYPSV